MKKRFKNYAKLNLFSIVVIFVSFISVTLAWFAYSGLVDVSTEVNIQAWNIELAKDGKPVTNNVVISLSDIYPGMETTTELITIRNLGDADAELSYVISSARILGDPNDYYEEGINETASEYIEDVISHEYPFSVNINLSKNYILSKGEEEVFEITFSWPLDSGTDEIDSYWGNKAHIFQEEEILKRSQDENYVMQPSVHIKIAVSAQQYLEDDQSSDYDYNLGDEILVDMINNKSCDVISETCIKAYVMDINNKVSDATVTLLPNPYRTYPETTFNDYLTVYNTFTSSWSIPNRYLTVDDILHIISTDIERAHIIIDGHTEKIIGYTKYQNRLQTILNKVINNNGHFEFDNEKFNFLTSNNCYWTNTSYNELQAFALIKEDEDISKVYGNDKDLMCRVIPIIEMNKDKL